MKIIGKTGSSGFIAEISEYEIAMVMGYGYPTSIPNGHKPDVGSNIDVSKLYSALSVERGRQDEIKSLAASLRKVADRVDSINAALDCPIVEAKS